MISIQSRLSNYTLKFRNSVVGSLLNLRVLIQDLHPELVSNRSGPRCQNHDLPPTVPAMAEPDTHMFICSLYVTLWLILQGLNAATDDQLAKPPL